MTRAVPHRVGLYLALLQLLFTLGWTVYAIYLPQLAASVGIPAKNVIWLLMLDQIIFTVTDVGMGTMADRISKVIGRLGHWVAALTALSCLAFLALPFIAGTGQNVFPLFLSFTIIWAITSSALRAPPLMLLGKYAAKPAIPWLSSLSLLGLGIAGAVSPYLAIKLKGVDPRLPFVISSVVIVLVTLALASVERALAREAAAAAAEPAATEPPQRKFSAIAAGATVFVIAMVVLGLGYQMHFAINSSPQYLRFAKQEDLPWLMPLFWVGFNIAMMPASLITKRWGGLAVMGIAGILGAGAIYGADTAKNLNMLIAAQLAAGAAWGCILMSAFSAALILGEEGGKGRMVGFIFSALAVATFTRMATVAFGAAANPTLKLVLQWLPVGCWIVAGLALLYVSVVHLRAWAQARQT